MPTVDFEGQQHQFPDDFSDSEISSALASMHPQQQPSPWSNPMTKLPSRFDPITEQTDPASFQAERGARNLISGQGGRAQAASDLIRGTAKMAAPLAIPMSAATAGVGATVGGLLGGAVGAPVAGMAARTAGADPGTQALAEDVGGMAGGMIGGGVGQGAESLGRTAYDAAQTRPGQEALTDLIPYWGSKINKLRNIVSPEAPAPAAPEPVRAKPGIARTIQYTPSEPETGYVAPRPSGGPAPQTTLPDMPPPGPFRPNPNVARTIRFTPPSESDYTGAQPVGQTGWKPPEQSLVPGQEAPPTPQAPKPFKPNPRIAAKIRSTPSDTEAGGGGGTRPVVRPVRPIGGAAPAQAQTGLPDMPAPGATTGEGTLSPEAEAARQKGFEILRNRRAIVENVKQYLRENNQQPPAEGDTAAWRALAKQVPHPKVGTITRGLSPESQQMLLNDWKQGMARGGVVEMAKGGIAAPTPTPATAAKDPVRGSIDIPVSPEGAQEANNLGADLATKGFGRRGDTITPGRLVRGKQTAQAIADHTGARMMQPNPAQDTWPLGGLEGQDTAKVKPMIKRLIDHPNEQPPPSRGMSSEPPRSFNQWSKNYLGNFLKPAISRYLSRPGEIHAYVVHGRGVRLAKGWFAKGMPDDLSVDPKFMLDETDKPTEVHRIGMGHKGKIGIKELDPSKDRIKRGGILLIRHARTPMNKQESPKALQPAMAKGA
jgi:broad specificity phosphatase PhoE